MQRGKGTSKTIQKVEDIGEVVKRSACGFL
jgi:hypothetical protein